MVGNAYLIEKIVVCARLETRHGYPAPKAGLRFGKGRKIMSAWGEGTMANVAAKRIACGAILLWALALTRSLNAQVGLGTWVRKADASASAGMTMIVGACCNGGRRITYHIPPNDMVLTVESQLDGRDAPVMLGGKPSGETMAIKLVDDLHMTAVLKINGKTFGTAKGTISPDGKILTVEDNFTSAEGGQPVGKQTETWVRK